jgi:hypothetical protein
MCARMAGGLTLLLPPPPPLQESSLGVFKATMKKADLPKSVDYRNTGYDNYGTVKTQADCGSCW